LNKDVSWTDSVGTKYIARIVGIQDNGNPLLNVPGRGIACPIGYDEWNSSNSWLWIGQDINWKENCEYVELSDGIGYVIKYKGKTLC